MSRTGQPHTCKYALLKWALQRREPFGPEDVARRFKVKVRAARELIAQLEEHGFVELWEPSDFRRHQAASYHRTMMLEPVDTSGLVHERRCELAAGMGG